MVRIVMGRVNIRSKPSTDSGPYTYSYVGREAMRHGEAFNRLVSELNHLDLRDEREAAGEFAAMETGASRHEAILCRARNDEMFALDRLRRWVAISVPNGMSPVKAVDDVQNLLRTVADKGGIDSRLIIDVDPVARPRRVIQAIEELGTVVSLSVEVKLPNPGRVWREERRRMVALAAETYEETYTSQQGINLDRAELEQLTQGVETGDIEVAAESATGSWSMRDEPEEFAPEPHWEKAGTAALLLAALAWVVSNWPMSGSGGAH
ncbi:hypothetical protein ABZ725_26280 [Streptomyces sp. NPDC006872]|uniref:hypothetical protein n=1 Tax=Streptomyces sp. NPDC006872 TaxID=3155720 RepID=UPI00340AD84B